MFTLMEESVLLLEWSIEQAEGTQRGVDLAADTVGPMLSVAPGMELALRGRIRMNRFRPIKHRSRWRRSFVLSAIRITFGLALIVLSLAVFKQSWVIYVWPDTFVLIVLLSTYLFGRKLVIIDTTPTGDTVLDEELQEMFRTEARKTLHAWFAHKSKPLTKDRLTILTSSLLPLEIVLRASAPPKETPLVASLEEPEALISASSSTKKSFKPTVTGLAVNLQSEEWQELSRRVRGALTGEQAPDTQVVALLLLVTLGDLCRFTKLPREDAIIYQLCTPEERAAAHARLTAILKGDPTLAMQIGEVLYDTLLGIRDSTLAIQQRK